jgi:hypothetical protein
VEAGPAGVAGGGEGQVLGADGLRQLPALGEGGGAGGGDLADDVGGVEHKQGVETVGRAAWAESQRSS